jgi:hypothetical protein
MNVHRKFCLLCDLEILPLPDSIGSGLRYHRCKHGEWCRPPPSLIENHERCRLCLDNVKNPGHHKNPILPHLVHKPWEI